MALLQGCMQVLLTFLGGTGLSGDGPDTPGVVLLLDGEGGTAVAAMLWKGSSALGVVPITFEPAPLAAFVAELGSLSTVSRTAVSAMLTGDL